MVRQAAIGVLLAAATVCGGCAQDAERDRRAGTSTGPREVAERFSQTIRRNDLNAACALFVTRVGQAYFGARCASTHLEVPDFMYDWGTARVTRVHSRGDRATVLLNVPDHGQSTLGLVNVGQRWLIDEIDRGPRASVLDQEAIEAIFRTELALGRYSRRHRESLAGLDVLDLRKRIKPPAEMSVTTSRRTYTIQMASRSGNVFRDRGRLTHGRLGGILFSETCERPGVGLCRRDGRW